MIDKYEYLRFDIYQEDAINNSFLETLPFNYTGSATEVVYETNEFTSVCPWTGFPDFGKLIIRYIPDTLLVELKSLKYYLMSYRNVGILQEHAVNRILHDLVQLLKPISLTVEGDFNERGGLKTKATAKYNK